MDRILRDRCANCGCCVEVTKNFIGDPIDPKDYYYQCIASMEGECYEDNSMYDEVGDDLADINTEEIAAWLDTMEAVTYEYPVLDGDIDEIEV